MIHFFHIHGTDMFYCGMVYFDCIVYFIIFADGFPLGLCMN